MPTTHTLTAAAMLAGVALFLTLAVFTFLFFVPVFRGPLLAGLRSGRARFTRLVRIVLFVDNTFPVLTSD
jgi:hypothetical protein